MAKKEKVYKTIVKRTITKKNKFSKIRSLLLIFAGLLKKDFTGELNLTLTQTIEVDRED